MKDLLISHIDLDGVSPNVLLSLTNRKFEYKNIELSDVDKTFDEYFKKDLKKYENIYIVDLTLTEHAHELIQQSKLNNIHVFDHHASHEFAVNYDYTDIRVEINVKKTCGTELFYLYLKKKYKELNKPNIEDYVDLVTQLDTYTFKDETKAQNLNTLHDLLGHQEFIKTITRRLKKNNKTFEFTQFENKLFKIQRNKIDRYIQNKESEMKKFIIDGHKCGVVFAETNKSELGNYLSGKNPDLDLIVLCDASSRFSLRTKKDDVDLNVFASHYSGGGHKKAAGIMFSDEDRKKIIENFFKEVKEDTN